MQLFGGAKQPEDDAFSHFPPDSRHYRRFLRASDLEEGGSDQQFYLLDSRTGQLAEAPHGTLSLGDVDPTLRGSYALTLRDGRIVELVPAMELLAERLADYIPEKASKAGGVHPEVVRTFARAVALAGTSIAVLLGTGTGSFGAATNFAVELPCTA